MLEVPPFDAEELVVIVAIKAVAFVPEAQPRPRFLESPHCQIQRCGFVGWC